MCGIIGCYSISGTRISQQDEDFVRRGIKDLKHRGPDNQTTFRSKESNFIFGHTRLSILDLSEKSNQPMVSKCRSVLTYNGEIYNFKNLEKKLPSHKNIFDSDTEFLINFLDTYSYEKISQLRGMYAGAFYNGNLKELLLFRDPLGIKPLYYIIQNEKVYFCSSLKVLIFSDLFKKTISYEAIVSFLMHGHLMEGLTPYHEIKSLGPGKCLQFKEDGSINERSIEEASNFFDNSAKNNMTFTEIIDETVSAHLLSDVPVVVLHSAGLDSNLIAKSASKFQEVNTFSIGFDHYRNTKNDEVPLAIKISKDLGYKHNFQYISQDDLNKYKNKYLQDIDVPSVDGFNSWLVCRIISENGFKVALSGAGGDEVFKGYSNFKFLRTLNDFKNFCPLILKNLISHLSFLNLPLKIRRLTKMVDKNADINEIYFLKRLIYDEKFILNQFSERKIYEAINKFKIFRSKSFQTKELEFDLNTSKLETLFYCKNQLVKDADWSSMAHSLEMRVPFFDKHFISNASAYKKNNYKRNKKDYYKEYIPNIDSKILERSKTGFSLPILDLYGEGESYQKNYLNYMLEIYLSTTGIDLEKL